MHALGMYLAITNGERDQEWVDDDVRAAALARADARRATRREPARRRGGLSGMLRRRLLGIARA